MFGIPKKNKVEMRTVGDFRRLNPLLERIPCHIEPVHELIMSVGRFKWGSAFDLNMGYYVMKLCALTRKFCRLITIFGTCECQVLAMGVSPAGEIFQRRMEFLLMKVNPRPKIYFDDIMAAMWHEFEEHIQWIDEILTCFGEAGSQVNLPKSVLCQKALAWVSFWM